MARIDYVSVIRNLPPDLLSELNDVWDETHGKGYRVVHRPVEETKELVLYKYFNDSRVNRGEAFYDERFEKILSKMEGFIAGHADNAARSYQKRFGGKAYFGFWVMAAHSIFYEQLILRLVKIKKLGEISEEKAKDFFMMFEFAAKYGIHNYTYDFFDAIIFVCETKLKGE